ncbi:N-6 DNA methylase [Sphaerisporangium sp. B11E5]|uniref:N-6 DNA methylase n=1 Tax=Sphaerisporangium sp. B11E5 TaxID=3153563 RepID=UPI00325D15BD
MSQPSAHVTAAEISRLAGVTRATVSNWRRRHPDFPAPVAGSDASPLYDLAAVRAWLESRGQVTTTTAVDELRTLLRWSSDPSDAKRLYPFAYAALTSNDAAKLLKSADDDLAAAANRAVAGRASELPIASRRRFEPDDAALLRAVLRSTLEDDGPAVLDTLAERGLTDTHISGAYGTPPPLAGLMAGLLERQGDGPYPHTVLDPACGSGSLLEAAGRQGARRLLGQDRLDIQALNSAVRLKILLPDVRTTIKTGDSLLADAFADRHADAVLCNPPFADRDWGHDDLIYDQRWTYGVPPRGESELAWVQHALAHLIPGGHAVLLMPPGTAFRPSGRAIRTELLKAGALRAVIALPPGVVIPLHIGLQMWVLRRPGQEPPGDRVLMMDVGEEQDGQKKIDWTALADTVLPAWRSYVADPMEFEPIPDVARAVPVIELLGESVDLTPVRHLRRTALDPAETSRRVSSLRERLSRLLAELTDAADARSWAGSGPEPATWRTATVSDLAKGKMLTVLTSGPGTADDPLPARYRTRRVLLSRDVATGTRATGVAEEDRAAPLVELEAGDVLLPRVAHRERLDHRVADEEDAGCLLGTGVTALRVDPARLDPWFLAGFLLSEENLAAASRMRQSIMLEPRRLKVPLLPLTEQRPYGEAFRNLHRLRRAARETEELAAETARTVSAALTEGALAPPESR